MARNTKIVNVIDVESTCWEDIQPHDQVSEIIEIGLVELDLVTGTRLSKQSIMVRPQHSTVSPFCTALTGHTQADVDRGVTFPEAFEQLRASFGFKNRVMVSWGDYDRKMFDRMLALHKLPAQDWRHLNLKQAFSMLLYPEKEVGMSTALDRLRLPLVGRHHNGADDAANIATILLTLQQMTNAMLPVREAL